MRPVPRPEPGEYAPYTIGYFNRVPDDILDHMMSCLDSTPQFFEAIPADLLDAPHEPGEWTVKEILQHISDDERIHAHRAFRYARNHLTEVSPFDQNIVAEYSLANTRSLESLIDEYRDVRRATLSLFEGFPEAALQRLGKTNEKPMSVRAAAFHIGGHEAHHLESIQVNYLSGG